jgi:hypothetical protein
MVILQVDEGCLWGTYTTAVSGSGCAQGSCTLVGITDTDSGGQAIAFSVCWKNDR